MTITEEIVVTIDKSEDNFDAMNKWLEENLHSGDIVSPEPYEYHTYTVYRMPVQIFNIFAKQFNIVGGDGEVYCYKLSY